MQSDILVELYRNDNLECVHRGHAVVMDASGDVLWQVGNAEQMIFPRSSCKMLQAMPLVESGAAREAGLTSAQLALSCASHNGEAMHVERVRDWLGTMEMGEDDLRCGPQAPKRWPDKAALHDAGLMPSRAHNNCSGKHAGFLTLNRHIGGGTEYHELDHPLQETIRARFAELTETEAAGWGIDGCSAPNFMTNVSGLARAAAKMARGEALGGSAGQAASQLTQAMMEHPELVAGTGRACTDLMRAAKGQAAIKTGAEGVYLAILPERQIGVALKIEDGATRAAETAIAALLVRLNVLDANDPDVARYLATPLHNFAGLHVGDTRASAALWQNGKPI